MHNPDRELELLEQEFQRSRRAWMRETPIDLDRRILSLAAGLVPAQRGSEDREGADTARGDDPSMPIPPPTRVLESERPRLVMRRLAAPDADVGSGDPIPPPARKALDALDSADRQHWLDTIADLVKSGEVDAALYLLQAYRSRFAGDQ